MRGIHRWPVNSPYKRPVTRKMFPFDDVIMLKSNYRPLSSLHMCTIVTSYTPRSCGTWYFLVMSLRSHMNRTCNLYKLRMLLKFCEAELKKTPKIASRLLGYVQFINLCKLLSKWWSWWPTIHALAFLRRVRQTSHRDFESYFTTAIWRCRKPISQSQRFSSHTWYQDETWCYVCLLKTVFA